MSPESRLFEPDPELWECDSSPYVLENPIEATLYFAEGFHYAAQTLVGKYEQGAPEYDSVPIAFLYRHAMELALKSIIWLADEDPASIAIKGSSDKGMSRSTHRLTPLLANVDEIIEQLGWKWTGSDLAWENAKAILSDLDNVDPLSFAFRYPIDKHGSASQPTSFSFNVVNFGALLDKVFEGLATLGHALDSRRSRAGLPPG